MNNLYYYDYYGTTLEHTEQVSYTSNEYGAYSCDGSWEWAEANQSFLDFSKFERYALGPEPNWVADKRKRDIKRSMHYLKTPWTPLEDSQLKKYLSKKILKIYY